MKYTESAIARINAKYPNTVWDLFPSLFLDMYVPIYNNRIRYKKKPTASKSFSIHIASPLFTLP